MIFEKKIEKIKGKKGGLFSFDFIKNIFNKKTNDKTIINKWKEFRTGLEKHYGLYLFQTMGAVIKATKMLNKENIKVSEKIKLHEILKHNANIFNFLNNKNNIQENIVEYPEILIPDEHPELITSLSTLQKNLENLKQLKKRDLPKEQKDKIDLLYNLYLKQKNIFIENEASKYKAQIIRKNCIKYEQYLKEEEEKRNKAIEEENKQLEEIETKKELKEKQQTKKLIKESFYENELSTDSIYMNQTLPKALEKWEDDIFIPCKSNLCPCDKRGNWILNYAEDERDDDVKDWDKIEWSKPDQIIEMNNFSIILKEPKLENVIQGGNIGDCYFLSSIGALCSHKTCINKLFHVKSRTKENAYGVYLFLNGKWRLILLDDYLPCIKGSSGKSLCFASSLINEICVSLLEKAWAKVNGSYLKIGAGGYCNEAFDVLTEAYTEHIYIQNLDKEQKDNLWKKIEDAIKHKYMICIGTPGAPCLEPVGLANGHAYSLIDIYTLKTNKGKERIVKMRNPWGEIEYTGRWSDYSKAWTEELKKICKLSPNKNDGIFHMSYEYMLKYFFVLDIAKLEPEYKTKVCKIKKKRKYKMSSD